MDGTDFEAFFRVFGWGECPCRWHRWWNQLWTHKEAHR